MLSKKSFPYESITSLYVLFAQVIQKESPIDISAVAVCTNLLLHVLGCTQKKRQHREQIQARANHNPHGGEDRIHQGSEREPSRLDCEPPGKLDHAAVVAFEVGLYRGNRRGSVFDFFVGIKDGTRRASSWNLIVRVSVVLRRTVVGSDDWRLDNLSGIHQLTLENSAIETLKGGQFTSPTHFIKTMYLLIPPTDVTTQFL